MRILPRFEYLGKEETPQGDVRVWDIYIPGKEFPVKGYEPSWHESPGTSAGGEAIKVPIDEEEKPFAWLHTIGIVESSPPSFQEMDTSLVEKLYLELLANYRSMMRARTAKIRTQILNNIEMVWKYGISNGITVEDMREVMTEAGQDSGYFDWLSEQEQ